MTKYGYTYYFSEKQKYVKCLYRSNDGERAGGYANTDKIKELGFSCRYSLEDSIKTVI